MMDEKAKPKTRRRRNVKAAMAVETHPDAWERFTGAVKKLAPPRRPKTKADG